MDEGHGTAGAGMWEAPTPPPPARAVPAGQLEPAQALPCVPPPRKGGNQPQERNGAFLFRHKQEPGEAQGETVAIFLPCPVMSLHSPEPQISPFPYFFSLYLSTQCSRTGFLCASCNAESYQSDSLCQRFIVNRPGAVIPPHPGGGGGAAVPSRRLSAHGMLSAHQGMLSCVCPSNIFLARSAFWSLA